MDQLLGWRFDGTIGPADQIIGRTTMIAGFPDRDGAMAALLASARPGTTGPKPKPIYAGGQDEAHVRPGEVVHLA